MWRVEPQRHLRAALSPLTKPPGAAGWGGAGVPTNSLQEYLGRLAVLPVFIKDGSTDKYDKNGNKNWYRHIVRSAYNQQHDTTTRDDPTD